MHVRTFAFCVALLLYVVLAVVRCVRACALATADAREFKHAYLALKFTRAKCTEERAERSLEIATLHVLTIDQDS